jgi:dephospho-CoA kinase
VLLVGLTGGIGSGKSTVAGMLAELGAVVLDADTFARAAVEPGTPGFEKTVRLLGPEVTNAEGGLDRAEVARRVFSDEELRRRLEAIIHPEVRRMVVEGIEPYLRGDRIVVVDSPLLIETGAQEMFEVIVLVSAEPRTQLARLTAKGMEESDARARIASQMPADQKARYADVILDNEGTIDELRREVEVLWTKLNDR